MPIKGQLVICMNTVNKIVGFRKNTPMVEYLETLLNHVKNGEIIGFANVSILSNGNIMDGYTGIENDVLITIAGLEIVKRRIMSNYVDIPEEEND